MPGVRHPTMNAMELLSPESRHNCTGPIIWSHNSPGPRTLVWKQTEFWLTWGAVAYGLQSVGSLQSIIAWHWLSSPPLPSLLGIRSSTAGLWTLSSLWSSWRPGGRAPSSGPWPGLGAGEAVSCHWGLGTHKKLVVSKSLLNDTPLTVSRRVWLRCHRSYVWTNSWLHLAYSE